MGLFHCADSSKSNNHLPESAIWLEFLYDTRAIYCWIWWISSLFDFLYCNHTTSFLFFFYFFIVFLSFPIPFPSFTRFLISSPDRIFIDFFLFSRNTYSSSSGESSIHFCLYTPIRKRCKSIFFYILFQKLKCIDWRISITNYDPSCRIYSANNRNQTFVQCWLIQDVNHMSTHLHILLHRTNRTTNLSTFFFQECAPSFGICYSLLQYWEYKYILISNYCIIEGKK